MLGISTASAPTSRTRFRYTWSFHGTRTTPTVGVADIA
jgi:hypothetical protein